MAHAAALIARCTASVSKLQMSADATHSLVLDEGSRVLVAFTKGSTQVVAMLLCAIIKPHEISFAPFNTRNLRGLEDTSICSSGVSPMLVEAICGIVKNLGLQ